jgi:NADPH:quinone reductase-like Zn-dependent oxidoreductase
MRAIRIREHGGLDRLILEELPVPIPGAGELRVQVRAVGVNHLDLWVRRGVPGHKFPLPIIPGCDLTGVVDRIGDGVTGFSAGDQVVVAPGYSCGTCLQCRSGNDALCRHYGILGESTDGGCVEYVILKPHHLFPRPGCLSFEEAAAMPLVFLTAWHMLVRTRKLSPTTLMRPDAPSRRA